MWRSRLRATFLSSRDGVEAGDEAAITHKTGYDIYSLLVAVLVYSNLINIWSKFRVIVLNCLIKS